MPDYIPNYETPVDNGLDPQGWWPGKKHSWKERLGQVATLGVWNPDDRTSSDNNKAQLKSRAANQEALYQMTQNLIKVNIDPVEAAKMANQVFASKYMADIADNQAGELESEGRQKKAMGYNTRAGRIGLGQGDQDIAAAEAAAALNTNMGSRAKAEGDMGVPAAQAFNAKEGENATLGELQMGQTERRLKHQGLVDAEAERRMIEGKTMGPRMDTATSKAQADAAAAEVGRIQAEAEAGLLRNPGMAERLQRLQMNRQTALPAGYGGRLTNLMDAEAGESINGPAHLPSGGGGVGGYTVTEERRDPVTGEVYTLNKSRMPLGAPAPIVSPTGLGPTPQVLPNLPGAPAGPVKKPIRVIGN